MKANKLSIPLAINQGDTLNSIPVWKVKMTRQDVKQDPSGKTLRARLLDKGIAHSFYENFLWIVPIDGKKIEELNLKEVISDNFLKWNEERLQIVEDFTSDLLWYPVSIVLLRDAIRYALRIKLKDQKNLVIDKLSIYDKNQIIHSGTFTYVVLGISLEKILRINVNNVCICPELVYECYELKNRPVIDPFERQRNIIRASRCDSKEYCRRLDLMSKTVFPLKVNLSNKTLMFKFIYHELIREEKKIEQKGLEQWF